LPTATTLHGLCWLAVFLALLLSLLQAEPETPAARPPGIVVILTDDVGAEHYGFQGDTRVPTPRIDSIARDGVRFTAGYSSAPVCSPARAGLLTGRYATRFGHEFNGGGADGTRDDFGMPKDERTLADHLRTLGYATCAVGKWHLGAGPEFAATARGFDEFYGTVANTTYVNPPFLIDSRVSSEAKACKEEGYYTTSAFATRARDWLRTVGERPFFLYLALNSAHVPLQAPPEYLARFAHVEDPRERLFAAVQAASDDAVGIVLDELKALDRERDTLVFFLSDNGSAGPSRALRGAKGSLAEGGVRVPFALRWPARIPTGVTCSQPVLQLDVFATALAAAGGTSERPIDGVDLVPFLTGEREGAPHAELFWRYGDQWAVRAGDWKLVQWKGLETPRLVDLAHDPREESDRSAAEPELVRRLQARYAQWNAEQAAPRWQRRE
jgi:arylsulfatase A-like enzyme